MVKNKVSPKKNPLTLHGLLVSLSFWGTATRFLLFAFIATAVFVVALSEAFSSSAVDYQIMVFIYVLASFLLLDAGYVLVARRYALRRIIDIPALYLAELVIALLYVAPKMVVSRSIVLTYDPLVYALFVPIVVLGIRMLLGILFSTAARR